MPISSRSSTYPWFTTQLYCDWTSFLSDCVFNCAGYRIHWNATRHGHHSSIRYITSSKCVPLICLVKFRITIVLWIYMNFMKGGFPKTPVFRFAITLMTVQSTETCFTISCKRDSILQNRCLSFRKITITPVNFTKNTDCCRQRHCSTTTLFLGGTRYRRSLQKMIIIALQSMVSS